MHSICARADPARSPRRGRTPPGQPGHAAGRVLDDSSSPHCSRHRERRRAHPPLLPPRSVPVVAVAAAALQLLLDGLGLGLSAGRDPGVQGDPHHDLRVRGERSRGSRAIGRPLQQVLIHLIPAGLASSSPEAAMDAPGACVSSVPPAWTDPRLWRDTVRRRSGCRDQLKGSTARRVKQNLSFVSRPSSGVLPGSARFRRLARDYERLPELLAGLHLVAFTCLMLHQLIHLP